MSSNASTSGHTAGGAAGSNLPASMQARLAAYQQALKAKRELHRVQAQGADVEGIKSNLSELAMQDSPRRQREVGKIDVSEALPHLADIEETPEQREERIKERRAKTNLHKMFLVVEGTSEHDHSPKKPSRGRSASPTPPDNFTDNRLRYLTNIERLQPQRLQPHHRGPEKFEIIAGERVKKDAYGSLKTAWDHYEEAARDRPRVPTEEEKKVRMKLAKVEDRIDMAWVHFAEEVVKRAVQDQDMPPSEIQIWKEDRDAMARANVDRRKQKIKRERLEEKEYWKAEVMRLRQEAEAAEEEEQLASDEEWVTDSEGALSDPDERNHRGDGDSSLDSSD